MTHETGPLAVGLATDGGLVVEVVNLSEMLVVDVATGVGRVVVAAD